MVRLQWDHTSTQQGWRVSCVLRAARTHGPTDLERVAAVCQHAGRQRIQVEHDEDGEPAHPGVEPAVPHVGARAARSVGGIEVELRL